MILICTEYNYKLTDPFKHSNMPYCKIFTCSFPFSLPLDLDFLSSSSSGQQNHFPKLHNNHYKSPGCHAFPPGRSPYHCSLCGRDFNRKHHLKIHQRIHTGERPYTCSICSARFRHALTLKRHFRLHTGEKPYVCGQCGKKFRNDGGLKVHQCS